MQEVEQAFGLHDLRRMRARLQPQLVEERLLEEERLVAPSLLPVEVAAAVRRLTGDRALATAASSALEEADWIDLYDLTAERAGRAGEIAASTGVQGADAVYLELAVERGEELVTWDRQQLERGRWVARVVTL